jgi:hypothetical protein
MIHNYYYRPRRRAPICFLEPYKKQLFSSTNTRRIMNISPSCYLPRIILDTPPILIGTNLILTRAFTETFRPRIGAQTMEDDAENYSAHHGHGENAVIG